MSRLGRGVQAGLLAGAFVAVFYFVADLIHLAPLSTPAALSRIYIPGGPQLDTPGLSQIVSIVTFAARLLVLTALHLLVFALLAAGAVARSTGWIGRRTRSPAPSTVSLPTPSPFTGPWESPAETYLPASPAFGAWRS